MSFVAQLNSKMVWKHRHALALALGTLALAHQTIPHRARGGAMWAAHVRQHGEERFGSTDALWITLPVDHAQPDGDTFPCRYYVDSSGCGGAPCKALFFVMGGEGPAGGTPTGYIAQLAAKRGARVAAIEHRYYGDSVPGGAPGGPGEPNGLATAQLAPLTATQALADAAKLIEHLGGGSADGGGDALPTFTFGGSYSGALSAWFRGQYPTHTRGSLSSSGVVDTVFNFTGFDQQVREAIGEDCAAGWELVTRAYDVALQPPAAEKAAALAQLGLRPGYLNADLYYLIADAAAMADQYGRKDALCAMHAEVSASFASAANLTAVRTIFAAWVAAFHGAHFSADCFYDTACLRDATQAARWQPTARAWRWQKCNELGYLQPAPPPAAKPLRSAFLTLAKLQAQCETLFGDAPAPYKGPKAGALGTLQRYGGATAAGNANTTRVFFSDFSDDPWQRASVRAQLSPELPYRKVTCDGCGHCMDLHAANDSADPAGLTAERAAFEASLEEWLGAPAGGDGGDDPVLSGAAEAAIVLGTLAAVGVAPALFMRRKARQQARLTAPLVASAHAV